MDRINKKFRLVETVPTEMTLLRVIPDRSVKNNENRRLWRLLHDLMLLDHGIKNRTTRDGIYFSKEAKDQLWIECVFRCSQEEITIGEEKHMQDLQTIEYYLAVPTKYVRTFTQKVLDRFPQVTLEEAELSSIEVKEEAELTNYKFQRHDIFSLHCHDNDQNSPISALMNIAYDLKENDFVRLSIAVERVDRKKWRKLAEYAFSQVNKKKIPPRAKFDAGLLGRQMGGTLRYAGHEVHKLATDVLQGVNNSLFAGKALEQKEKQEYVDSEYAEVFIDGKLSNETKEKMFEPVFKTKIRLAVCSSDRSRKHIIKQGVTSAFSELNRDNALLPVKLKNTREIRYEMNQLQNRMSDRDINIMSCKEIGKLHQYPTAQLQELHGEILESKRNVEVEVPKVLRDPSGILLGYAEYRGNKEPVYLPVPKFNDKRGMDEFMMSRAFIGSPRMGKDTALANFVVDAAKKGAGSIVLDVVDEEGNTRGLSDSIRDALPADKIIDLNIADVNFPFYLGLHEITSRSQDAGNFISGEFVDMYELNDVEQTRMYMREAIKACNADIFKARMMFMGKSFLEQKIKELQRNGKEYAAMFWDTYLKDTEPMRAFIRKPIMNRMDDLFGDDILKNMFAQKPNPDMDFIKWMKEGKVVLVRCPIRPPLSANTVKQICRWIIMKTFLAKQLMQDKECPTFLILNEPHQFLTDGLRPMLERMLKECPKMRLSLIFAFHDFAKTTMPESLQEVLLSSSLNWHIFKNSSMKAYEKLRKYLEPTYTPDDAFDQTPRFHSINSFFIGGEYIKPFMMATLPPVNERITPHNNKKITKDHSLKYGRPRKQVEKDVFDQEKVLFVKAGKGEEK